LLPLSFHPPAQRSARVLSARMFEPPSGSLRAKPAIFRPCTAGRKKRSRCASVPAFQIGQMPRWLCADQLDANPWLM
jgi:hypothetical protein